MSNNDDVVISSLNLRCVCAIKSCANCREYHYSLIWSMINISIICCTIWRNLWP